MERNVSAAGTHEDTTTLDSRYEREFGRAGCLVPCYVGRLETLPQVGRVCCRRAEGVAAHARLYGPGTSPRTYSQVVSPHALRWTISSLSPEGDQAGRIDNAVLAAYEMFTTSTDVAEHLWRGCGSSRLKTWDGSALGPVLIDVLHRNFNATRVGLDDGVSRRAPARFPPKDRTSSEHADWVATKSLSEKRWSRSLTTPTACTHARSGAGAV